jgi:hypothetical protein
VTRRADLHIDAINALIGTLAVLSSMSNTPAIFFSFSEFGLTIQNCIPDFESNSEPTFSAFGITKVAHNSFKHAEFRVTPASVPQPRGHLLKGQKIALSQFSACAKTRRRTPRRLAKTPATRSGLRRVANALRDESTAVLWVRFSVEAF